MSTEETTAFDEAFDPSKEEGTPPLSLIPRGKYAAEVIDASVSATKNRKGTMLNLTWQLLVEGSEYDRRYVFQRLIIQHESADATRFGRQKIKDLCDACGVTEAVTDVDVFKYKKCLIYVAIEHDETGEYGDKNKVTRIMPLVVLNTPHPATSTMPSATTNGGETPPIDELPDWAS